MKSYHNILAFQPAQDDLIIISQTLKESLGFTHQAKDDFVQSAPGSEHYKQIRRTLLEVNNQQHKDS